jgi:hypothetical protein
MKERKASRRDERWGVTRRDEKERKGNIVKQNVRKGSREIER